MHGHGMFIMGDILVQMKIVVTMLDSLPVKLNLVGTIFSIL